jgi:hypothetical protein
MTNKNKEKGKYFENKIVQKIRKSFELKPHECRRADESGNGTFEYGDIYFTDFEKYPFVFECKFHESWTFQGLFPSLNKIFLDWYEELYDATIKYNNYYKHEPYFSGVVFSKSYHTIYCIGNRLLKLPKINYENKYKVKDMELYLYSYDFEQLLEYFKTHYIQIHKESELTGEE